MAVAPRSVAIGWLATALVVGFAVVGSVLYDVFIGLDSSGYPLGPWLEGLGTARGAGSGLAFAGIVIVLLMVIGFVLMRAAVRSRSAHLDPSRRTFLTGAASGAGVALGAGVLGAGAAVARAAFGIGVEGRGWAQIGRGISGPDVVKTHPEWKDAWRGARVRKYRRLGRTNFAVSDIVVGSGPIKGEKGTRIVREALDRGVNYVDTSPDYSASGSEQAVGEALVGRRDEVFLATKFCTPGGHLPPGTPVPHYKAAVEESLRNLKTDYVDLIHIHSCDEVDRLMDPNAHEAFDRLKEEGKVRFLGVSTHTPNLVPVANRAIESDRFDVMMLAYHHGIWAPLGEIVERAHRERDIGVVAMKTLKGAKHHGLEGFREESDTYAQAALKWVLSNPDVSCAVISFFEDQHVDEYLFASGRELEPRDLAVLEKYDRSILGSYCSPHCGVCLDRCPEGLAIHDVLRYRMYFEDYGWQKDAMQLYARLERTASACAGCRAPCLGSCPVGIPIQERMTQAHELLTLA
ncbi:MAG: aldo/keto reductase [Deltaproteobacteria bacterium]|nr:MAG: aldo/keto reductase [Deltaproteobacteria bacterium]